VGRAPAGRPPKANLCTPGTQARNDEHGRKRRQSPKGTKLAFWNRRRAEIVGTPATCKRTAAPATYSGTTSPPAAALAIADVWAAVRVPREQALPIFLVERGDAGGRMRPESLKRRSREVSEAIREDAAEELGELRLDPRPVGQVRAVVDPERLTILGHQEVPPLGLEPVGLARVCG